MSDVHDPTLETLSEAANTIRELDRRLKNAERHLARYIDENEARRKRAAEQDERIDELTRVVAALMRRVKGEQA